MTVSTAPGAGIHERWALIVDGAGTAVGCDIDNLSTSCSDTTDSFPLTGDTVWLEATETTLGGGAPAAVSWSIQAG